MTCSLPIRMTGPRGIEASQVSSAIDLACAAAIVLLSLASYARRTRRAHLLELAVAAFLVAAGWLGRHGELAAAAQNELASGLVLAMLAIVPSEASRPPETWRARG